MSLKTKCSPQFLMDIFEDWYLNKQSKYPLSMTKFCEDWAIPRSTFSGWLAKQAVASLPADRFYSPPETITEPTDDEDINGSVLNALRMLAQELTSVSKDLNAIVNRL